MGGPEANQGLVLPKMAEVSEEYVSFLGYILTLLPELSDNGLRSAR